jgi:hypothetical protein
MCKVFFSHYRGYTGLAGCLGALLSAHRCPENFPPTRSDDFFSSRENKRACSPFPEKTIDLRKNYRLFVCSRREIVCKLRDLLFNLCLYITT